MSINKFADDGNEEYIEENLEETSNRAWTLLKNENEKYRQENHNLKRKLELNETMLREVQESNELLECTLDQRISEKDKIISIIEEKHRIITKEYENTISNLESRIAEQTKEIEKLQHIEQHSKTECVTMAANHCLNTSFETTNTSLSNQVDELSLMLQEERKKNKYLDETIKELNNRCNEFEHYCNGIKEQLDERSRALEDARAELTLKHAETGSIETEPIRDTCKGNSLFAEVEDRRRNAIDKMNVLREKYTEIKRVCKSQVAEIRMLRAERATALRKWEDNVDYLSSMNDELIQKYKNRISDLENKLKFEIKKNDDTKKENCADVPSLGYFQTLMYAKNKEIDQLRLKIEDLSTKMLIQEETKMNTIKQMQYWRHKASTLEAQITAIQAESKIDAVNSVEHEVLNE